jgi:hypothetical protein
LDEIKPKPRHLTYVSEPYRSQALLAALITFIDSHFAPIVLTALEEIV